MGALIGLTFGLGVTLVWSSFVVPRANGRVRRSAVLRRADVGAAAAAGVAGACVALLVMGSVPLAVGAGAAAGWVPRAVRRARIRRRARERAELWPDVVDNLASAVRAGLSLPDALIQIGERGPAALREPFLGFRRDYESSGRFHDALDRLKGELADPVGDRVVEALRIARDVGGGDLGRLLRTLSAFLREDARTRGEIASRQSWSVNGARLAVAAPWLVVLAMSTRPDVAARYTSAAGLVVLAGGAGVSAVAYRAMAAIGRLPAERRFLA